MRSRHEPLQTKLFAPVFTFPQPSTLTLHLPTTPSPPPPCPTRSISPSISPPPSSSSSSPPGALSFTLKSADDTDRTEMVRTLRPATATLIVCVALELVEEFLAMRGWMREASKGEMGFKDRLAGLVFWL